MLGETLEQAINSYKTSNYFPEIWQPYRNDYEFRGKTVRYTSQASHRAQGGNRNDAAVYNKGTANISGNAVLTSASTDRATVQNDATGAVINISGGTITSTNTACQRGAVQNVNKATVNITGGTIISKSTPQI